MSLPTISEELAGKHVFVTGGSGFMGKVLVEKLLRSCPDVECIYLLLRPKRGVTVQDRVEHIVQTPLFAPLLSERPLATAKLRAVAGDCSQLRLGLSADDEALLVDHVSYVFHAAATVRFDDPLQSAILLNTRGTREVVELCKRMPRLQVLQYVSTTYCFTKEPVLEERAYRAHLDWRTMIRIAETEDKCVLDAMTHKILDYQPNTYTFTKALAENVINDARHDIPVIICRPAVVLSSLSEPLPGWVDNLNGPFSIFLGVVKGVVRYTWGDPDVALSYTPVDWAIRGMVVLAVAKAKKSQALQSTDDEVDVVNMETTSVDKFSFGVQATYIPQFIGTGINPIRYPRFTVTTNYAHYWVGVMLEELPYGIIIDLLLRLSGQQPRMTKIYRKKFFTNQALSYFMLNKFPVEMGKLEQVHKTLRPADRISFGVLINDQESGLVYERLPFMKLTLEKAQQYVFRETSTTEKNNARLKKLYALDLVLRAIWYCLLFAIVGKPLLDKVVSLV